MFGRALVMAASVVVLGCGGETPQGIAEQEESLKRIEARLARMEARLQALDDAPVPAKNVVVELPAATPAKPVSRIAISVTPTEVFIDGEAVAPTALAGKLEALAATSPDASVVVQADPPVAHQRVTDTMGAIKKAGFARIAIATRSDD